MEDKQEDNFCRICYSDVNPFTNAKDLISPCNCVGSVKFVHYTCLKMWRMKGKRFSDIRKCEQCQGYYNIRGEKAPHSILVSSLTILIVLFAYSLSTILIKNIFDAFLTIIDELSCDSLLHDYNDAFGYWKTYHLCCIMLSITLYKIFTTTRFLVVFNYIFTFWRLIHFNFIVDKILFVLFSIYFIKQIYIEVYNKIDGLYYYLINLNWSDCMTS